MAALTGHISSRSPASTGQTESTAQTGADLNDDEREVFRQFRESKAVWVRPEELNAAGLTSLLSRQMVTQWQSPEGLIAVLTPRGKYFAQLDMVEHWRIRKEPDPQKPGKLVTTATEIPGWIEEARLPERASDRAQIEALRYPARHGAMFMEPPPRAKGQPAKDEVTGDELRVLAGIEEGLTLKSDRNDARLKGGMGGLSPRPGEPVKSGHPVVVDPRLAKKGGKMSRRRKKAKR